MNIAGTGFQELNKISCQKHLKQDLNKEIFLKNSQRVVFKGQNLVDDTFQYQPENAKALSNDKGYEVLIDGAGAGTSKFNGFTITRGSDDPLRKQLGNLFYLRSGKNFWSAGLQPTLKKPDKYETEFTDKKVKIVRQDSSIQSKLQVVVSPEDNAEIRRISLTNKSNKPKDVEVTSYSETPLVQWEGHKAFTNLFVTTKYLPEIDGIIANRRPRSPHDKEIWAVNTIRVNKDDIAKGSTIEYETAREKFIGRNRTLQDPAAMSEKHLSNTAGIPLDPVASLRTTVKLEPHKEINIDFITVAGNTENEVVELAKKYNDAQTADKVINQESRGI
ncbi:MAG: hypothetical protein ACD_20C00056G0006 [uncultured bacterium]|nr:MAG: hypothetical protein ACD_20C00056G0006 [uncultured bacterium]